MAFRVEKLREDLQEAFSLADASEERIKAWKPRFDAGYELAVKALGQPTVSRITQEEAEKYEAETGRNPWSGGPAADLPEEW